MTGIPNRTGLLPVSETEACLVRRCLSGDPSAAERFVERFGGLVHGLCLRMLRRREDAEDAAQETFARTFRNLHRWDPDRPLTPWLAAIAANRCRTALDRRRRLPHSAVAPELLAGTASRPESAAAGRDLAEELGQALQDLRPEYRRCFELFYGDDLGIAETARRLGIPEGTVKTWLYRARKELAARLSRRGVTPGGHDD